MINISKEYFEKIMAKGGGCQAWHGFESDCSIFLGLLAVNSFIGANKFFLPIYLVKIALNRNRVNTKYFKEQLRAYFRSVMYTTTYVVSVVGGVCVVTRVFGTFYWFLMCTGIVAGFAILIEYPANRGINTMLLFNQFLEMILNYAVGEALMKRTPKGETLIFMSISAALMYLFKTQKTKKIMNLWFYPVSNLKHSKSECGHKDSSCLRNGYKGAVKYFGIGYALEIVKTILPRFFQVIGNPRAIFDVLFRMKNVRFGLFLGGYVAIYRYVLCLLTRANQGETAGHSLIAGFLAGSAYRLKPNMQILIIGITTILQLLSQRIKEAYNLPEDFPYYLIVFIFSCDLIIHSRFLLFNYCPVYSRNMCDVLTNYITKKMDKSVEEFIRSAELKLAAGM